MKPLKKLLLSIAMIGFLQSSIAQTYNYDIHIGMFNTHLGSVTYNRDDKKLFINIDRFVDINYTYQLLNDSTYIETNKTDDVDERFVYQKDSLFWNLKEYNVLDNSSHSRLNKSSLDSLFLEKSSSKKSTFSSNLLTPIDALENIFNNNISTNTKMLLFGNIYELIISNKTKTDKNTSYRGNILSYIQNPDDKFLLEKGIGVECKEQNKKIIPTKMCADLKILYIIPARAKVKLKSNMYN